MKKSIVLIFIAISTIANAQDDANERARPIVEEGNRLYKSEMASWYGTDLFMEKYSDRNNIGGYFSYVNNAVPTCIFFSRADEPKVIGAVMFDSSYNTSTASVNLTEREFSAAEKDIFTIRQIALSEISSDTMFRTYKNTSLNLIPIINGSDRKVYVLTGPEKSGIVIFGNDYLLTFDAENKLVNKKQLHKNIISIEYSSDETGDRHVIGAAHTHLPETGEFITATDICTLMLYEKFAKWQKHTVVSKDYMSLWDCTTDRLLVISMHAVEKIEKTRRKKKQSGE
jgi:hypothetical protein